MNAMHPMHPPGHEGAVPAEDLPQPAPAHLDTQILFDGQRELVLVHKGEAYRLRITRHDKLILTK